MPNPIPKSIKSNVITPSGIKLESSRRRAFLAGRKRISTKKQWVMKKIPNLALLKPGDMLLTINTRSTPSGLKSQLLAKLGKGPYAHTATYLGRREQGTRSVRDFDFWRGGKTYPLNSLTEVGTNYKVVRWAGSTDPQVREKQIKAFVKNIEATNGKYDVGQLLLYSLYHGAKSEGAKKVIQKYMVQLKKWFDDPKRFTCVEAQSEAADPYDKMVQLGERVAVSPPLKFHQALDKEVVTPAVVYAAIKAGILKPITECEWKYN